MTGAHSPWPLFCNDLDQAQQWVSDQLARSPTDTKLGHQALSLGLNDAVPSFSTWQPESGGCDATSVEIPISTPQQARIPTPN